MNSFSLKMLFISISAILLWSCSSEPDFSWAQIKQAQVLRVGIIGASEPMSFYDPVRDRESGFEVEIGREICKRLGVRCDFKRIFWLDKYHDLDEHHIDCILASLAITAERKQKVLFSSPYVITRNVVLVKKNSSINSIDELFGKKIGYLAGSSVTSSLRKLAVTGSGMRLTGYPHFELGLMQLANGYEDVMVMDEVFAIKHLEKYQGGSHALRVLDEHFGNESLGIGLRRVDQTLYTKIEATLNAMEKDGTLPQLRSKWLGIR